MLETLDLWLNKAIEWYEAIPIQGWAIIAGLLIGGVVTQWVKRNFPLKVMFPNLTEAKQKLSIRTLALFASALPTFFIWPDDGYAIWAAIAVGFGTPTFYKVSSFFVYKKFPDLKDRFTGTQK